MSDCPTVLLDAFGGGRFASSWRFAGYVETVIATCPGEVVEALHRVEQGAAAGLYAAGFVAYEAASALNPDLSSAAPVDGLPLVWFALFRERSTVAAGTDVPPSDTSVSLHPRKTMEEYAGDAGRIRSYIAAGDCYQVNYTFPLEGSFSGSLRDLYPRVGAAQRAPFCAYLNTGRFTILSASPELFFSLKNGVITTRPMKGTARRGRWAEEDRAAVERLRGSAKERAENLMIVDLLRNDLSMVAETGSVVVESLFDVETYPTVHQMTSTVAARLRSGAGLTDIFTALFPCGSVTGAPKRRSMEIIAELEEAPRGIYCGAIGVVAPGGEALFSVAIRTLLHDAQTNRLIMGVGSAVTWDSAAPSEYAECLDKGAFLHRQQLDFRLIESLRLENGTYTLLARHLSRLAASAEFFGFPCDQETVRQALIRHAATASGLRKTRLLLSADGDVEVSSEPLEERTEALRVAVSSRRVDSSDTLRYHKTTCRELFDAAWSDRPDCDEVLLVNEQGQLAEGSYHTLVVKLDGQLVTPPLECGLLPGVLREELLNQGTLAEMILTPDDLKRSEELWLINSVRGWQRCVMI